ncbi:RpoE-regulated lipoprotein [Rosenbergiella australiborealis]|uniref:RpoE-regulated lipoprotein n=1 Tax=Rosenbergiella australiborealis TaxID=1544696 RepID=UPI001F4EC9FE|nr:RpoE-regulated lipoprotein [Rosenbergiella australiborealis]
MKALPCALLASVVLLNGCASSGHQADTSSNAVRWWNPLSYSWSSALPWNWFGSSVAISEKGVGNITALTAFNAETISQGIGSDYQIRQGMGTRNGQIESYIQAMKGQKVAMTFYGDTTVSKIDVTDTSVHTPNGIAFGAPFSALFQKAYGHCQPGRDSQHVQCQVPNSQHLDVIYHGEFNGPSGIMPADDTLKQWTLSEVVWHA